MAISRKHVRHYKGDQLPELHSASMEDINSILEQLTSFERHFFNLRNGLSEADGFCFTTNEVAHIFKTSPSRVSRIYRRARAKFLDGLSELAPESQVDQIVVRHALEHAATLTPFLIEHLRRSGDDLRLLPWHVFEHLVAEFFASWGYEEVFLVGRRGSTAADVFAMKRVQPDGTEVRMFVETKRWRDRVGVEVIDRVYGAFLSEKTTFGWHMAMVVTVAGFTEMKKYTPDQLRMMGISLKSGDDILKWLKDYRFNKSGLWLPDPQKHFDTL